MTPSFGSGGGMKRSTNPSLLLSVLPVTSPYFHTILSGIFTSESDCPFQAHSRRTPRQLSRRIVVMGVSWASPCPHLCVQSYVPHIHCRPLAGTLNYHILSCHRGIYPCIEHCTCGPAQCNKISIVSHSVTKGAGKPQPVASSRQVSL